MKKTTNKPKSEDLLTKAIRVAHADIECRKRESPNSSESKEKNRIREEENSGEMS